MAMETHAAVAEFDSQGELTIYSPNQTVYGIRSFIADLFDMDYNKVRVVKTTMGGSTVPNTVTSAPGTPASR